MGNVKVYKPKQANVKKLNVFLKTTKKWQTVK